MEFDFECTPKVFLSVPFFSPPLYCHHSSVLECLLSDENIRVNLSVSVPSHLTPEELSSLMTNLKSVPFPELVRAETESRVRMQHRVVLDKD